MSVASVSIEQLAVNTIRTLSMDGVEQANSGHPGTPMALAPVAYALWQRSLRYDPAQPLWPNRDRFVLSCGHASMLIYSLIYLAGIKEVDASGKTLDKPSLTLEDLKQFRQWGSKTPGHPEYHHTTGVETTTGPLGQGVGNSVGMAIASRYLAAHFNKPGFDVFNFNTYALCSDGDLMEGISGEAASIAGHLKLSNLCWIYDNNGITIEGHTSLAFSEEVATRFTGYGWKVLHVKDANSIDSLTEVFYRFRETHDRPTLVIVDSHIGWGSPNKQDTHDAHGAPLGAKEIELTKAAYGWPNEKFFVPPGVLEHFQEGLGQRGKELSTAWNEMFAEYKKQFPDLAKEWEQMQADELPAGWDSELPVFPADKKGNATRNTSGKVLEAAAKKIPWLLGGSADLAPSTKTNLTGLGSFEAGNYAGRNFHFGIREHAMGAIINGMNLCHLRAYGSTFLVFSDYCRPSMRLACIMKIPSLYIFTHDSIGVGEDGPTHQPIEHLSALRAMPGMLVMRPGDANEATEAWRTILPIHNRPVTLVLTRQNLPTLDRTKYAPASGVQKGAYIVADAAGKAPQAIIMTTGSELGISIEAYEQLTAAGIPVRVVSMPCWELFDEQPQAYRDEVLPPSITARVAVEMATSYGWARYVGLTGKTVCIDHYGASAPIERLAVEFGFTTANIVAQVKSLLGVS